MAESNSESNQDVISSDDQEDVASWGDPFLPVAAMVKRHEDHMAMQHEILAALRRIEGHMEAIAGLANSPGARMLTNPPWKRNK